MSYELLKHTADLRLQVKGQTLEELFAEALKGLTAVLNYKRTSEKLYKTYTELKYTKRANELTEMINPPVNFEPERTR